MSNIYENFKIAAAAQKLWNNLLIHTRELIIWRFKVL